MKILRPQAQRETDHEVAGPMDTDMLFRAHADFVAAFLRRLGVPPADVDDAVQEVFMVTHRKGGYQPGSAQPTTWLATIAVLIAQASARKRANRRETADEAALADGTPSSIDPHVTLAAREGLARVQAALDTLDLPHRAAFVLYELEGESCEAIAAAFGIPLGTVHSRLHHARQRFIRAYTEATARDAALPVKLVRDT